MPPLSLRPLKLLIAVIAVVFFVVSPISVRAETKGKKKSVARPKTAARATAAKRAQRKPQNKAAVETETNASPESYPIAPDKIEVIENGSASSSSTLSHYLYLPPPRSQPPIEAPDDPNAIVKRKINYKIEESRATQIQEALKLRGFYAGEPNGVYDQATIDAMRRFQTQENIPITGYPTAHALKRLGLSN